MSGEIWITIGIVAFVLIYFAGCVAYDLHQLRREVRVLRATTTETRTDKGEG